MGSRGLAQPCMNLGVISSVFHSSLSHADEWYIYRAVVVLIVAAIVVVAFDCLALS